MNTHISENNRIEMAKLLNHLLANEYVLYTKTWKHHWNISGKHFGALHAFFDTHVTELATIIDKVAERVRALNVMADGTLREFIEKTSLIEHPGKNPNDLEMIQLLLTDHEEIIRQIREHIKTSAEFNDHGTNNLLCDLLEEHEKMAWMLRAYLS